MSKKTVLIIFGGVSPEHEVSLRSAASVLGAIDRKKYEIIPLGITRSGDWFVYGGPIEWLTNGTWEKHISNRPCALLPSRNKDWSGLMIFGRNGAAEKVQVDCIFPVLHGSNGEDGVIQGLFELSNIPFVGCGVAASAVCMDKTFTKSLCAPLNIVQAEWMQFLSDAVNCDISATIAAVESRFKYPVFVKPANTGSSVGISKAKDRSQLVIACVNAAKYDEKILIEEFVDGRELEVAVLGNKQPITSCPGEILPSREFYTYESKYHDGTSGTIVNPDLPDGIAEKLRENAKNIFLSLGCRGLARVDFFLRKSDNTVVFNEINTLPGFTDISMYGKLFAAENLPYPELLDRLIELAFENKQATTTKIYKCYI